MKESIGLLETYSIPTGMYAADVMLKASNVELVLSTVICPGKYIVVISGNVGAVKSALVAGKQSGGKEIISTQQINNIHLDVALAIRNSLPTGKLDAIGVMETRMATDAILVADMVMTTANVELYRVGIGNLMGGKGLVLFVGELSQVKAGTKGCLADATVGKSIISSQVIANPSKALLEKL